MLLMAIFNEEDNDSQGHSNSIQSSLSDNDHEVKNDGQKHRIFEKISSILGYDFGGNNDAQAVLDDRNNIIKKLKKKEKT